MEILWILFLFVVARWTEASKYYCCVDIKAICSLSPLLLIKRSFHYSELHPDYERLSEKIVMEKSNNIFLADYKYAMVLCNRLKYN